MALGEAYECGALGTLVASGVPDMRGGEGEHLVWAMSSARPFRDDPCGEGGILFGESGSIFPALKGTSSPLIIGTFGAMDAGLLGEMPTGSCSEVSGIAIDSSSSISILMLGQETLSLGHSMAECRDGIGIENC